MPRAITIINTLLVIVIIALLAALAASGVSQRLGGMASRESSGREAPAAAAAAAAAAVPRTEPLTFYAPILSNGLFGKASQGQLTPIVAGGPVATAQAPATAPAELMLLGTVLGSFRETFALVRHMTRQEERVFRLGDMVFDAGRLAEVRKEQAYIVINGKKVELLTPTSPPPTAPATAAGTAGAAPAPHAGPGVAATGPGSFVIDQRALNAALDNIGQAMTDARLLPSQKDGKIEGFKASEVKPNGVFAMIGIRNGDVLVRLNDFPVDSPDKALQSFMALKGQNRLKLDLIREGQPVTFNYEIR